LYLINNHTLLSSPLLSFPTQVLSAASGRQLFFADIATSPLTLFPYSCQTPGTDNETIAEVSETVTCFEIPIETTVTIGTNKIPTKSCNTYLSTLSAKNVSINQNCFEFSE
jgi:hypothetical protein